jgi:uncharacterized delta-60 repeat protein
MTKMHRTELITLIIILTLIVIFIFYLKRVKILQLRQQSQDFEKVDDCCCSSDDEFCLTAWYSTFDTIFHDNTLLPDEIYQSVVVQTDGKVVIGSNFATGLTSFIQRFDTDGTPDGTFTPPGVLPGTNGSWKMVRIASDGSIFIVGSTFIYAYASMVLVKLTPSGAFDTSFGVGGFWHDSRSSVINNSSEGHCLHLLSNGKILVGGAQEVSGAPNEAAIARINADGTLDAAFGVAGFTSLPAPTSDYGEIFGLGVQTDGKIVGGGYFADGSGIIYGLGSVRFSSSGVLDAGYGVGGFNVGNFDDVDGRGTSAVFIDNTMYVGGWIYSNDFGYEVAAVTKFDSLGQFDSSWGNNGWFFDNPNIAKSYSQVNGVITVCDGGCFIGGYVDNGNVNNANRQSFICKLTSTGVLDLTFGDGNGYILGDSYSDFRQFFQHNVTELYTVGVSGLDETAVYKIVLSQI